MSLTPPAISWPCLAGCAVTDMPSLADVRSAARRKALDEQFAIFLDEWRGLAAQYEDGWVPLRLIGITGLTAWELMEDGKLEVYFGRARPLD